MKNTFVKVLSFLMALTMIVGTLGTVVVFAADCTHEDAAVIAEVEASCNSIGYKKYHCNTCGEEFIGDVVPSKGDHKYEPVPEVPATCTSNKITSGERCKVCGSDNPEKKPTEVAGSKLPHTPGTYYITVDNTCTENGFRAKQCLVCLQPDMTTVDTEYSDPASHAFVYTVNTPAESCVSGQVTITCENCDYNEVIIQKMDHHIVDMKEIAATENATALEKKYVAGGTCDYTWSKGQYCDKCWMTFNTVLLDSKLHLTDRVDEDGAGDDKFLGATLTHENITAEISALTNPITGEKLAVGSKTSEPETCTVNGWFLNYCSSCKKYSIKIVDEHEYGHKYADEWSLWTTTTANVTAGATDTYPTTKTADEIEASKDHIYVYTRVKCCENVSGCTEKLEEKTKVASHNFDNTDEKDYTVITPVTCTTNGYTSRECNKGCGYKDVINPVVAKGYHSFEAEGANPVYTKVSGYHCEDKAKLITTCTHAECDTNLSKAGKQAATKEIADTDAAHSWKKDVVPGTCMVPSHYQEKCEICNATREYAGEGKDKFADYADSKLDPSNHVATKGDATTYIAVGAVKQQKVYCTDEEITYYVCKCSQKVEVVTKAAATAHGKIVTGGDANDQGAIATFTYHVAGCEAAVIKSTTHANDCTNTGAVAEGCKDTCADVYGTCVPGDEGCVTVNYEPVAATCTATGMSAGKLCVTCGYVVSAPKQTVNNPDNHGTHGKVAGSEKTIYATCANTGKTVWNCAGCLDIVEAPILNSADGKTAVNDTNRHANMIHVAAKDPVCVNDGIYEHYYCRDCKLYFSAATGKDANNNDTAVDANAVAYVTDEANEIEKADTVREGEELHAWSTNASDFSALNIAKLEKCNEIGIKVYKFCTECQLAKTGDKADGWYDLENIAVIQLQDAEAEEDKTVVIDDPDTEKNEAYEAIVIKAHGLDYTRNWAYLNGTATCTQGAWKNIPETVKCLYCDLKADRTATGTPVGTAASVSANYWTNALAHKNADLSPAYVTIHLENLNEDGSVKDCTKETFKQTKCTLCGEMLLVDYAPAINADGLHDYELKEDGSYKTIKTENAHCYATGKKYVECTDCDYELTLEVIEKKDHIVRGGTDVISFACKDYATYKGLFCGDCNKEVKLENLVHNPVNAKKAVTCTEDGYDVTYCADCTLAFDDAVAVYYTAPGHSYQQVGTTATTIIKRCNNCGDTKEDPKVVVTNSLAATVSAEAVQAGDAVAVAVKASAAKAISTLEFKVTYDASKFDLADIAVTVNAAYADKVVAFANVSGTNTVTVIVFVQNTTDGAEQTIDLTTAAELLTINFVAKKYANGESTAFTFGTAVKLNGKDETANVTASKKVKVAGFGNVNGDALISVNDVKAVQGAIGSVNADLDFNGDGIVDIDDMNLIAKFVASAQTAKDYLVMIGVYAEIEAYVADMYATGNGYDFTNDNAMNNNDIYLLLKKVDTLLGADYKSITFEGVEEIVDQAVSALLK